LSKAQFKVVAGALRNRKYLKEVIQERGLIDKDNKQLNNIFNLGLNHYKNNNKFPTNIVMEDLLEDKIDNEETLEKYINLVEKIYSADVNDVDFYHFLSKAKDEKKDRLMQTGLSKVIDTLEFGKREQAEKEVFRLAKLLRKSDTGSRVKRSSIIDDDYVDYYLAPGDPMIGTSMKKLNDILGGGTIRGDLVIWQAGTGRGKSLALMEQADFSFEHEKVNVIFVTVEMGMRKQQDRFVARRLKTLYNTIKTKQAPVEHIQDLRDEIESRKNKFEIIDVPINSSTDIIRLEVEDFVRRNGKVDVIIVDPVYMIKALDDKDASWEEKGQALLELKQIGADFDSVVHTANQIKNKDLNSLEPDTDSGSQSFLYTAGATIALNIIMTDKMRKKNAAKIKAVKARDGEAGASFFIETAYSKMIFCHNELDDMESIETKGEDF
jgi:replicative DNA helicase